MLKDRVSGTTILVVALVLVGLVFGGLNFLNEDAKKVTVEFPEGDFEPPKGGIMSQPCAVFDGTPLVDEMKGKPEFGFAGSVCTYEGTDRKMTVTILDELSSVDAELARDDCQELTLPGGQGCSFSRPLGEKGKQSGSALVIQSATRPSTLNVIGESLSKDEVTEAAGRLAQAIS